MKKNLAARRIILLVARFLFGINIGLIATERVKAVAFIGKRFKDGFFQ